MTSAADELNFETGQSGLASPCSSTPAPIAGFVTVALSPAILTFTQPGRSYQVTCAWTGPSFDGYAIAAGINRSKTSEWMRDDSQCEPNQLGWTVYIPSNAGTAYMPVSMNISGTAKGVWSDPSNLSPVCTWNASAPIP